MNRKICSQYKQGTSMPSIDPWYDDKQNKLNHVDDKESSLLSVLPVGVYQTGIGYLDSASRNLFCCQNTCFPLLDLHHQSLEEVLPLSVKQSSYSGQYKFYHTSYYSSIHIVLALFR
jgi:hypothetical protein